ncbi:MAG: hypothetical protein QOG31_845 [Thermoplasmata archaeon]|nr:hypothetical protein [Thermoplasmata archaeon]
MRWPALLLVALLLPMLPLADAQELPEVRLNLHPAGAGAYRINTQPPRDTYVEQRPPLDVPGCAGLMGTSATYVGRSEQVMLRHAGGQSGYMDEARLQQAVNASAEGLELRWIMAGASPLAPGLAAPGVQVTVEASLRDATEDRAAAGPTVLAHGLSAPATLAGQSSSGAAWTRVGGLDVYEVTVPLAWDGAARFPQSGYTLLVQVRTGLGQACGPDGVAPPGVVAYADPQHAPSLRTRAATPPLVHELALSPGEEGRVVTAALVGTWGGSDVDAANATLEVRDASGKAWPATVAALQEPWRAFGHSFDPVRIAWVWNATGAPAGRYEALLTVPNLQHTGTAQAALSFQFQPAKPSPAAGVLVAVLALGLALLRRRS